MTDRLLAHLKHSVPSLKTSSTFGPSSVARPNSSSLPIQLPHPTRGPEDCPEKTRDGVYLASGL